VTGLVAHLITGGQFLGYSLHEARKGAATRFLAGFDPRSTPAAAAAGLAGQSKRELMTAFADVDGQIVRETEGLDAEGWQRTAEGPVGHIPVYVALNHFLWDSWVHERDLMLPAGEHPMTDPNEAAMAVSYVVGLAGVVREIGSAPVTDVSFGVRLTDVDVSMRAVAAGGTMTVAFGPADGDASVTGTAGDVVDFVTGRTSAEHLDGDQAALEFLRGLSARLG
jgi:hypothetical protein